MSIVFNSFSMDLSMAYEKNTETNTYQKRPLEVARKTYQTKINS